MLEVTKTALDGVLIVKPPTIFEDFRGDYVETYNRELYREAGIIDEFVQDDYATSHKHVLRGLHGDDITTKLVSCTFGELFFVVLDARADSEAFMKWESFELSSRNRLQAYVPVGYAIGYLVMSETAIFHYKQTTYFEEATPFTIKWNDPRAAIDWPVDVTIRSERDQ